jgi:hypothetical protein
MPATANDSRDTVRQMQQVLAHAAKRSPPRRFHALYDKLWRWDVLEQAWAMVRANRGQGGVDGQSIEHIEQAGVDLFLRELQDTLQREQYQPVSRPRLVVHKTPM